MEGAPELKGAVLLNQPAPAEPKIEDLTFVDLVGLAFTKATVEFNDAESGSAKREFAIAKTHLEDAVMRFTRGRSMSLGVFHVTDTESPEFLQLVQEAHSTVTATEGGSE